MIEESLYCCVEDRRGNKTAFPVNYMEGLTVATHHLPGKLDSFRLGVIIPDKATRLDGDILTQVNIEVTEGSPLSVNFIPSLPSNSTQPQIVEWPLNKEMPYTRRVNPENSDQVNGIICSGSRLPESCRRLSKLKEPYIYIHNGNKYLRLEWVEDSRVYLGKGNVGQNTGLEDFTYYNEKGFGSIRVCGVNISWNDGGITFEATGEDMNVIIPSEKLVYLRRLEIPIALAEWDDYSYTNNVSRATLIWDQNGIPTSHRQSWLPL